MKLRFWKKKLNSADSSAQHLANLLGTSVAGLVPQPPNDKVDLDSELARRNVAVAYLIVLSALVKGRPDQRDKILTTIQPAQLQERSFENYLFVFIRDRLGELGEIPMPRIEEIITSYETVVWGEPLDERSLRGYSFKWSQIMSFDPNDSQLNRAIELIQETSKRERGQPSNEGA